MHGTIEYAKTAEAMVKDDRWSVERRYEIACLNCLEDEARQLIKLIPNDRRQKYFREAVRYCSKDHCILISFFTCTLSDNLEQFNRLCRNKNLQGDSISQYLFRVVLATSTRATCEYFLKKVSQREKDHVLMLTEMFAVRSQLSPTCGLMFYLALLNAEQQKRVFIECIDELLPLLLHWPMQSFFMEAAKWNWQFTDSELSEGCCNVLEAIINKIRHGYQDYDYTQSFWELWRLSPAEYKQRFLDDTDRLDELFATKQKKIIEMVLSRAPLRRLKKLLEERYDGISAALLDEIAIPDAVWMEWKATAALKNSQYHPLRNDYIIRLVDTVMESRIKSREPKAGLATS